MIVTIDPQIFEGAHASDEQRFELFTHAYDGRHRIELDEAHAAVRAWVAQRDPVWRETWESARDLALRESTLDILRQQIRVVPGERDRFKQQPFELTVSTALRVLRLPLRILVENARTDGRLFLVRASDIGGRRDRLTRMLDAQAIEFENGNGIDDMSAVVDERRGDPVWRLRHYVVFDGDTLRPNVPSTTAATLQRRCAKFNIPHHCLARRSAENYLPARAIEMLWADRGEKRNDERLRLVRAYRDLDQPGNVPQRRHHFSLKKGFDGAQHDDALYAAVPDARRKALAHGFGDKIRDVFGLPHADWERWLLEDGQGDELGAMLDEVIAFR